MDPEKLDTVFRTPPALHRFPSNMARRTQELCAFIVERYGGDAARVWTEAKDGADLNARLLELPGFGPMKAGTIVAILGKQLGVTPAGWEQLRADAHDARRRRLGREAGHVPGGQAGQEGGDAGPGQARLSVAPVRLPGRV